MILVFTGMDFAFVPVPASMLLSKMPTVPESVQHAKKQLFRSVLYDPSPLPPCDQDRLLEILEWYIPMLKVTKQIIENEII